MLAAVFTRTGDPSVLDVQEVPEPPEPTGEELLVSVEASSINGTDLGLRRGDVPLATLGGRRRFVPGFDLAGTVLRCGPAVTAFAPGDRVMALLGHRGGGQAQRVVLEQRRAALVPGTMSMSDAAALPLAGLTALQALHGKAGLHARAHPRVLVNGASGGIGSYGVQLAKLAGAHVTGVASGAKLGFVTTLGADAVLDYREQDVTTLGERWDVVLDSPGLLTFAAARRILTEDGILVSTRAISPDALRQLVPPRVRRSGPRFAAVMTSARSADLTRLATLVDAGQLRTPVDRTFELAQVADAHRYAEGPAVGKVVMSVPGQR